MAGLDCAGLGRPGPGGTQQGLGPPLAFPALTLVLSRRKSKQALRDYKKVQIQLENLESSVRDRCKKEFTGEAAKTPRSRALPKPAPGLCPSLLPSPWDLRPNLASSAQQTL